MTLIAAYLAFFLAVTNEVTAFIALALVVAFCLTFIRSRLVLFAVALPAFFGFFSYGSFIPVAAAVALIFSVGLGAAAFLHANRILVTVGFAVAYGAAAVFTKDPLSSASVLLFALSAAVLAIAFAKRMRRTAAVCLVTATMLGCFAAIVLVGLWKISGTVNGDLFSALITEVHTQLLTIFKENAALLDPSVRPLYTEYVFNGAFDAVLCSLPAIVAISVSFLAFFAHAVTLTVCNASGYIRKLPERSLVFVLDPVSAILYLIAFGLRLVLPLLTDDAQVLILTVENLFLLLMPAFIFVGFLGIYGFLAKTPGCLNIWTALGFVLLTFYSRGYLLRFIAFVGVYLTFRVNRKRRFSP